MKYWLVLFLVFSILGCEKDAESSKGTAATDDDNKIITAVKIPKGQIFEYGIYSAMRKGRVLDSLVTNTGKIITRSVLELSETTDRIPMIEGTYFAYRFRIHDLIKEDAKKPAVEIRKVLIHPIMTLPDGTTTNGFDRIDKHPTSAGQVIAFDGYAFNEDYELVEGEWTFQIWYRDKMMVEQKFTTYRPEPEAAAIDKKAATPVAESKI